MNFSKKENKLALDWYANDAEPNGVEFVLKTTRTKNTQTVLNQVVQMELKIIGM